MWKSTKKSAQNHYSAETEIAIRKIEKRDDPGKMLPRRTWQKRDERCKYTVWKNVVKWK